VMLRKDRERWALTPAQAAGRLRITRREFVAIEAGLKPPNADTYDAICELFGWPDARRATTSSRCGVSEATAVSSRSVAGQAVHRIYNQTRP
jgi:DNA-binding XRE family transcriptional regulator